MKWPLEDRYGLQDRQLFLGKHCDATHRVLRALILHLPGYHEQKVSKSNKKKSAKQAFLCWAGLLSPCLCEFPMWAPISLTIKKHIIQMHFQVAACIDECSGLWVVNYPSG